MSAIAGRGGSRGLATAAPRPAHAQVQTAEQLDLRRLLPTLLAGALAAVYVIVSPPSLDLAAHLFRAKLFRAAGFGVWDNWWYAGHHTPGYSVLFPALAAASSPQLVAAIAATATAAVFEPLARRHFGPDAWLGALWFGLATATNLYTGRLTFAFGMLPAVGAALALQRGRPWLAAALALLTALASPVAALFAALAGAACAVGRLLGGRDARPALGGLRARPALGGLRARPALAGLGTAAAALAPLIALAVAFPEGGSEPFAFTALWPLPLICLGALCVLPRRERTIRAGAVMYALACIATFAVASPVGSNVARLGPLIGGPLAALALWPARRRLLLLVVIPLLYLQLQAPVRDVSTAVGDPSASARYWWPLTSFLDRQAGPPFRIEIPFTAFHREVYELAPRHPLARGWERQLDIKDDALFYRGRLTPARYYEWLHQLAVRFVAVSDARLDYSAVREQALIDRGLPYLRLIGRTRHWRIYAVREPTPIVTGAATLSELGPNSVTLAARRAGSALVRVRFTPYWKLSGAPGCVAPAGDWTRVVLKQAGPTRLVISFTPARVGARSPRCTKP
jgi:hypothetical protein